MGERRRGRFGYIHAAELILPPIIHKHIFIRPTHIFSGFFFSFNSFSFCEKKGLGSKTLIQD